MKPIYLPTAKCSACGKKVVIINMIKWDGKLYGKGCFNRHIKPLLDAKKLEGKEFYKIVDKTVIGIIATQTSTNYFTKSIVESANKGYLSFKQIRSYMNSISLSERIEIIVTLIESLNIDINIRYVREMTQQWLGKKAYVQSEYDTMKNNGVGREERKNFSISKEREAMEIINDLYNSNETFKKIVDENYKIGGIIEYCLEIGMFIYYENILDEKLDKIYG